MNNNLTLRMIQWFGFGASMLEISSLKPLGESKDFPFWVELVAPSLPSEVTSPMLFASYCIGAGGLPTLPKGSGCGFALSSKEKKE